MQSGVIIIGGGQAGLEAAAALRKENYQGSITLICGEPVPPYQRPPLSKDFLLGKHTEEQLFLRATSYYEAHNINLRLDCTVVAIDRTQKRVMLNASPALEYEKLILAVGARNRMIRAPGAERVFYLRSLSESQALKQALESSPSIAVIGGGFIGLEVAAAASKLGKIVTVIEAQARLMARAVPQTLSDFFLQVHRDHGETVLLETDVAEITPDEVICSNGHRVAADLVVAGIGVRPNQELAQEAGLTVGNGIRVDEFLRTSDPDIYAIGDCAEHPNRFASGGERVRLESVQNAVDQAKCVVRGIAGNPAPYRDVPWFWTDQFDIRFQMAGLTSGHDQQVLRGNIDAHKFSLFYFRKGKLRGVDSVNRFGDHVTARKLLAHGIALTPEQAADESVDLKKLAS